MKRTRLAILSLFIMCSAFSQNGKKDEIKNIFAVQNRTVTVYTTADSANLRLSITDNLKFTKGEQPLERQVCVFVNPNVTFQTILGFGGAITDASAEVFSKIPKEQQQELLNAIFDKEKGIGYSLIRTNINSCDFSSDMYTYVADGDKELKTFNIDHDKQYRIPFIKKAKQTAGGNITVFASPWSPPAFMKTNKDMLHGGKLLPEYYESWALYYTKFIKAYEKEGIPVWGISVQNEPMAVQRWESCIYTAEEERDFLKNYLGPIMKKEGYSDKKIIVWDHNRDLMTQRANTIFNDAEAAKYAWGMGFHWYESWGGQKDLFNNVANVHESFPSKNLLFTEGCNEQFDPAKFMYWPNAERYGNSIINDLNSGTVGWTDWNILLDEKGGPNHVGNFCFAPVHFDISQQKLIFTPAYYYIGHFSKFIQPKAKRVSTTSSKSYILCTSFLNDNNKMATVVMNQSNNTVHYILYIGLDKVEVTIPAHGIQTLTY